MSDEAGRSPAIEVRTFQFDQETCPPGCLLRADYEPSVPFHGRETEMEDLVAWVDGDRKIAVRLYTGPGGMGKTRLMLELCRHYRDQPESTWLPGFLGRSEGPLPDYSKLIQPQNLLIVIDYAETRRDEVVGVLGALLQRKEGHCRVVLLARSSEDWWRGLRAESDGVGPLLCGPATAWQVLSPVAQSHEERQASFEMARQHFSHVLAIPTRDETAAVSLEESHFEQILLIQMMALAALEGVIVKGDTGILSFMLGREKRFWEASLSTRNLNPLLLRGVGQLMAVITLGGGVKSESDALEIIELIPELGDQPAAVRGAVATLLNSLYGHAEGSWIEPILPDLLGEQLVDEEYTDHLASIVFGPPDEDDDATPVTA